MPKAFAADRLFTWIWLTLSVAILLSVRLHLLSMPFERDEGEYALGGWMILQGKMPYSDFYNMKFPGIYLLNALFISLFGGGVTGPHLGLLVFQLGTVALVYLLARNWTSNALAALAALITTLMMLSPSAIALAGHATHYVSFFAVLSAVLFVSAQRRTGAASNLLWIAAGIAAALAVLMKQQGAFVALGLGVALLGELLRGRLRWPAFLGRTCLLLCGFLLPLLATIVWLGATGALGDARFWAFSYAGAYGSMLPVNGDLLKYIVESVWSMLYGSWAFWMFGAAGAVLVILRRQVMANSGLPALMLLLTFVSVTPGFYFRPHYFIVCFPFIALSLVNWLSCHSPNLRKWGIVFSVVALAPTVGLFHRVWWVASPDEAVTMIYGNSLFVQSEKAAAYIQKHSGPNDMVLIVGSEPEICYLAERMPATPFLYWYTHDDAHRLQSQLRSKFKIQAEMAAPQTRWIILVNDLFSLYHYPVMPNETMPWLNEFIHRHHFTQEWVLTSTTPALTRQDLLHTPGDLQWAVYEGDDAHSLQIPPDIRYISAFRRP